MKPAVCLRCDWAGETKAARCPNCSAALFRPADREDAHDGHDPGERGSLERQRRRGEAPSAAPLPTPEYEPVRRSNPAAVLALVTAILVVGTMVFFGVFTEPEPTSTAPPGPAWSPFGTLVFAVSAGGDRARLWRWELATGRAESGSPIDRPLELVSTAGVSAGSVGMTSTGPDGRGFRASLVRFPGGRPEPLLDGELLGWASGGTRVVGVRRAPARPGCGDASWITSFDLVTEAFVHDLRVCAEVTSVARASITTFFTRRSPAGTSIDYVGINRSHRVLDGFTMLAASPTGDLLVVAGDAGSGGAAQLYWQGNTAGPVPYGSAGQVLFVDRVLAWSPDAGHALVLGSLGLRPAVWSIRAGPSSSTDARPPELVVEAVGHTWATYAADGTAYIESNGRLMAFREGRLQPVQLPPGVPTPDGPLVWLP